MNKKHIAYLLLGMVLLGTIATLSMSMASAQGGDYEEIGSDQAIRLQNQGETTYRFRARTRVRINSSHQVNLNMNCDALGIGDRGFSLDIETDGEYEMNMTCVREQEQLGVQNGTLVRNQNRHQVRMNFAARIQVNRTVNARIGMEMTRGDALRASWAYFDEPTQEWVEVESTYEDGMLVTETTHFSVWTIVDGANLTGLWIGLGVGVVAIAALAAILIRKKKVTA